MGSPLRADKENQATLKQRMGKKPKGEIIYLESIQRQLKKAVESLKKKNKKNNHHHQQKVPATVFLSIINPNLTKIRILTVTLKFMNVEEP